MTWLEDALRLLAVSPPRPGTVSHVHIFHDRDCDHFARRECNCSPDVILLQPCRGGPRQDGDERMSSDDTSEAHTGEERGHGD